MRFTLPIIALAALAAPLAAAPQTDVAIVDVRISYVDIDLSTPEGRATLEQRVETSVRKACTIESKSRFTYGRAILDEKCFADARVLALAEVERIAAAETRAGREVAAN
ncbi:UrcA family protein [Erythrobacter sp. JK5]|uniref:UrcA family protein n=1 Tax=Erythrobacter sp. JK5 TaxID=2829500 RepID=UPI001BAC875E|nr:UrcA family protein [Erythrobacter sp. JK5]QUL37050.1 UrcA family protein [Erythrobacter sp. JK5]